MNPYSSQSSFKKDQKFNSQGTQYKSLLQKVNQILIRLLEDISSMYKYSGITFEVEPLLGVLVRLLTPFQILSYFHFTDISNLIKSENNGTFMRPQNKLAPNQGELQYEVTRQDLKLIPTPYQPKTYDAKKSVKQPKQNITTKSRESRNGLKKKFIRVLTEDQQITLIQWIDSKIKQNKYVRRKDIAYIARKLSKSPGFTASKNWIIRFLSRYPQIRAQLDAISRANKGRKVKENFSEISNSSQEEISKYNQNNQLNLKVESQDNVSHESQKNQQSKQCSVKKANNFEESDYEIESASGSLYDDESSLMENMKKPKPTNPLVIKNANDVKSTGKFKYQYGNLDEFNKIAEIGQANRQEKTLKRL